MYQILYIVATNYLRWLLGLRKLRFLKKVWNSQFVFVCELHYEKILFFYGRTSCIMKKHCFLWANKASFFSYIYHEIIICSLKPFDCAVNFKFCLKIFIFLKIDTNQTFKEQICTEKEAATVPRVKYQYCNFTKKRFLLGVFFGILAIFLRLALCRTSHHLISVIYSQYKRIQN